MTSYKNSNGVKKRIIFDLILFCAIFYTPWWFVAILAFTGAFFLPQYYEIIAFGVLVDILYGAGQLTLGGISGFLAAIIIFFTASYTRKAVR